MTVYISRDNSYAFAHYGVKGMKWGVRKDRYRSSSIRRGKSKTAKTYKTKRFSKGSNYTQGRFNDVYSSSRNQTIKIVSPLIEDAERRYYTSDSRSDKEAAYYDLKDWNSDSTQKGRAIESMEFSVFEENLPKIFGEHSFDDDIMEANPLKGSYGHEDNCACCTLATALRGKGYDLIAGTREPGGTSHAEQELWFEGGKFDSILRNKSDQEHVDIRDRYLEKALADDPDLTWEKADREIARQWLVHDEPEGSYGFLNGQYDPKYSSGGHSIFYEIKDGDVVCRDGQTGEKYKDFYDATKLFNLSSVETMRVDDKQPNWDMINASGAVEVRNDYYDRKK